MSLQVVVVGPGNVGQALADGISRVGHSVSLAVRNPTDEKYADLGAKYKLTPVADCGQGKDLVVLAVPAPALAETVPVLSVQSGSIVVDATNAVRSDPPQGFDTVGGFVASLVDEGVSVVKAFNTIGAEHLSNGMVGDTAAFLPIAGDQPGVGVVGELASAMGFDVVELGDRQQIRIVEDHARLWIHLAFACGWGRHFGFAPIGR